MQSQLNVIRAQCKLILNKFLNFILRTIYHFALICLWAFPNFFFFPPESGTLFPPGFRSHSLDLTSDRTPGGNLPPPLSISWSSHPYIFKLIFKLVLGSFHMSCNSTWDFLHHNPNYIMLSFPVWTMILEGRHQAHYDHSLPRLAQWQADSKLNIIYPQIDK